MFFMGENSVLIDKDRPIGKSYEGIEIWNRGFDALKNKLFPDDINGISAFDFQGRLKHKKYWKLYEYWFHAAGTQYNPESSNSNLVDFPKPKFGIADFFQPALVIVDLGCGGGAAALEMARRYPKTNILATDYELGKVVTFPISNRGNLRYSWQDWRQFDLKNDSIDRILSVQGVGCYGNSDQVVRELTRVAKIGALLRVDQNRGLSGRANFDDRLAEQGWDVWMLRSPSGNNTNILAAQLKNK